jgi:hypothetical protein
VLPVSDLPNVVDFPTLNVARASARRRSGHRWRPAVASPLERQFTTIARARRDPLASFVGLRMLVGIVKEERDHADRLRARGGDRQRGRSPADAIYEGCSGSASADHDGTIDGGAVLGAVPLIALGFGAGGEARGDRSGSPSSAA